ncbi:MAG TPA: glycosyltransferase [Fimbriimonadaceae bacterium]|nr:glycosyltransferase [Fimbriimonadaceae bacterium]
MRVAIFSDSVLPVLNGVSVSVNALVTELRNQGHSVHVFAPRYPKHTEPDPNTYRLRALETPWTKGFPIAYPPFLRMLRKFRRHDFDVIHTHTIGVLGFVGLRWAESHEIPIVSTYHTLYDRYAHYIPFIPRRYVRFKIAKHTNFYYNSVDHVITPSEAAVRWLRRHSVRKPVTVVPTGAAPRKFHDRSEVRQSFGIPPEQRIMLWVGRLAIEKNMEMLFEMAAIAFAQDAHLRLWVVGDGPYRAECQALARKHRIGDRVRFVGFVSHEEVARYYTAADIFVFSSMTETQGLVVQEAMTYGLPAVCVGGGGASASIEDGVNGFIVKNEPRGFAATVLDTLHDDDLYARLSDQAARSVRMNGTPEMCERVVGVYREVIDRKSVDLGLSIAGRLF